MNNSIPVEIQYLAIFIYSAMCFYWWWYSPTRRQRLLERRIKEGKIDYEKWPFAGYSYIPWQKPDNGYGRIEWKNIPFYAACFVAVSTPFFIISAVLSDLHEIVSLIFILGYSAYLLERAYIYGMGHEAVDQNVQKYRICAQTK